MSLKSIAQSVIRNHFFFYLFFSGIFFFTQVLISERDSLSNLPPQLESLSILKNIPFKPPMNILLAIRTYCTYIYFGSSLLLTFFKILIFLGVLKRPSYNQHNFIIRSFITYHFFALTLCAIYLFLCERRSLQRPIVSFFVSQGFRPPPPSLLFSLQYGVIAFVFVDTLMLTMVKFAIFASKGDKFQKKKKGAQQGGGKEGEVVGKSNSKPNQNNQVRRRKKDSAQ